MKRKPKVGVSFTNGSLAGQPKADVGVEFAKGSLSGLVHGRVGRDKTKKDSRKQPEKAAI